MRHRWTTPSILLCLFVMTGSGHGDTGRQLSLRQLVRQADVIVQGHVVESKPRQPPDQKFAVTRVTIGVDEQFKGIKLSTLTLELPVGSMGDLVQGAPGTPEFAPGEEVILFLQQNKPEGYRLVGGKQGKYSLRADPAANTKQVEDLARRREDYQNFVARLRSITLGQ